jgi:hypothetical protein
MKNAIVEKLRRHLSCPLDTECEVVYLLCEIRKLLDKQRVEPTPFALRLYCHWALHVDLSRPSTTMPFLTKVDNYVFNKLNAGETEETLLEEHALFRDFVYLETFRKELSQFLALNDLPTSLCDEDARWFAFLAAFASIIEDGSLACQSKDPDELRLVKRVTFTRVPQVTPDGHVPFGIKWDVLLKDKRRVEVEVGTRANHNLMRWSLRLIRA